MNTPLSPPCESFEHEIADLVDGLLNDVDARRVQLHLAGCVACRGWRDAYACVDADLQAALPAPAVGADFDARLAARIAELAGNGRAERSAAAAAEHDALLAGLRQDSRRAALLGAFGAVAGTLGVLAAAQGLLQHAPVVQEALLGPDRLLVAMGVSAVAVIGALAWTFSRTTIAVPQALRW